MSPVTSPRNFTLALGRSNLETREASRRANDGETSGVFYQELKKKRSESPGASGCSRTTLPCHPFSQPPPPPFPCSIQAHLAKWLRNTTRSIEEAGHTRAGGFDGCTALTVLLLVALVAASSDTRSNPAGNPFRPPVKAWGRQGSCVGIMPALQFPWLGLVERRRGALALLLLRADEALSPRRRLCGLLRLDSASTPRRRPRASRRRNGVSWAYASREGWAHGRMLAVDRLSVPAGGFRPVKRPRRKKGSSQGLDRRATELGPCPGSSVITVLFSCAAS